MSTKYVRHHTEGQNRALDGRNLSHKGLSNLALSAFSLLSRFEKAADRGYLFLGSSKLVESSSVYFLLKAAFAVP